MLKNFFKNVLIPEKIGNYYLIPQRVLGFDITKAGISVTQVYYSGSKIILEKFINQQLENDTTKSYAQRIGLALSAIMNHISSYDTIRTSLSSTTIVFKELTVPFENKEQISLILNYELEPHLPFSLNEAIADFIVIQSNPETKSSTILAAAAKKEYIQEHISYFQAAGLDPQVITVDLFDLYGLFKFIPQYASENKPLALIEIGFTTTRIAYIAQGKLVSLRTLSKGLFTWAKELAQKLDMPSQKAHEKMMRFGLDANSEHAYNEAIKEILKPFINEITFTLQSFVARVGDEPIQLILLLGPGAEITGINRFIQQQTSIECKFFDINALLKNKAITVSGANGNGIPRTNIMSLSTALITPLMQSFNLRKQEFALQQTSLFKKQFLTGALFSLFLIAALFLHSYYQISKLSKELKILENEIIITLQKADLTDERRLDPAFNEAEQRVNERESIWFAFSRQQRVSFLQYLEKLSTAIDRKSLGLKLNKLVIDEQNKTMSLAGQVRDFDALKILERELKQSNLFTYVPSLQTIKFDVTIPLKKNGEEL